MHRATTLLFLLLAGCAVHASPDNPLTGTAWRFAEIDGEPPVSDRAGITFDDGRLSATVGCNGMGGDWRIERKRLVAGPLMQTEMYCAGTIWDQEQAVGALLVAGPQIALDGNTLTLTSRGHSAMLKQAKLRVPQG